MFVLAEFEAAEILPLLGLERLAILMATRNGLFRVKVGTARLECLRRNQTCVKCGVVGVRWRLERSTFGKANTICCLLGDRCPWCSLHPRPDNWAEPNPHLNLYGFKLNEQGELVERLMTQDHILPRSLGGKNFIGNLQTMCKRCNEKKGNQTVEDL